MHGFRRLILWPLAAALILAAAVVASVFHPAGQALLIRSALAWFAAGSMSFSRLQSDEGVIRVDDLAIADAEGQWLRAGTVRLRLEPAALLAGRVHLSEVVADRIDIGRWPRGRPSAQPRPGLGIPVATLRRFQLDRVDVAALTLADIPVALSTARLSGSLGPEGDAVRIAFDLQGTEETSIAVSGILAEEGPRLDLRGRVANGSVDGSIAVIGADRQLSGRLAIAVVNATNPRLPAAADVDLTLSGTLDRPGGAGKFSVREIPLAPGAVSLDGTLGLQPSATGADITLDGRAQGIDSVVPDLEVLLGSEATFAVKAMLQGPLDGPERLAVTSSTIRAGKQEARIAGAWDFAANAWSGTAQLDLIGAARLFDIDDQTSRISATLDTLVPASLPYTGRLQATMTQAEFLSEDVRKLTGDRIEIAQADLRLDRETLQITALDVRGAAATVTGTATLARRGLDHMTSELLVSVPDASRFSPAAGTASLAVQAKGPFSTVQLKLTGALAALGSGDAAVTGIDLEGQLTAAAGAFSGTVAATGMVKEQPLTAELHLAGLGSDTVKLSEILISGAGVEGSGAVAIHRGVGSGMLTVKAADVGALAAVFGREARGGIDATLTLTGNDGRQNGELALNAENVVLPEGEAASVEAKAGFKDAFGDAALALSATAKSGVLLGRNFASLEARADGPLSRLPWELVLDDPGPPAFRLAAAAVFARRPDGFQLSLNRLAIGDPKNALTLSQPAQVTVTSAEVEVPSLRMAAGEGTLEGEINWPRATGAADIRLSLQRFSADALAWLSPAFAAVPRGATLNGTAAIAGSAADAMVDAAVAVAAPADDLRGTPAFDVDGTVKVSGGRARFEVKAQGPTIAPALIELDLPLTLNLSATRVVVPLDAPLSGTIDWQGDAAPLWALVPTVDHDLRGPAVAEIRLGGTLNDLRVDGGITLTNGYYANNRLGLVLTRMEAKVAAAGSDALTLLVTGSDGGEGALKLDGRIEGFRGGVPQIDATAELTALSAVNRDDVRATISGKLGFYGPLTGGNLAGDIEIVRGDVRLGQTFEPTIPQLVDFEPPPPVAEGEKPPDGATMLNINVTLREPIEAVGRGLDAWWGGSFRVGGTLSRPTLTGTLELDRGEFTFFGQTFRLVSGKVNFTGGRAGEPELSIRAERQAGGITAVVLLSGLASSPKVELTSTPPLPQDEVLARIMFSRSVGQLGPLEAAQIASAAAEMTGLVEGGLGGLLRRTFGLDVVSFGGASGNALVVGQRISRNIFVTVEQDVSGRSQQVVLEWQLTRSLSLESVAGGETGNRIGLSWQRNY